MPTFTDSDALAAWLEEQGIDLSGWGKGKAKTVTNLWQEWRAGETTLTGRPPLRHLSVVEVVVRGEDGRVLVEAAQELASGARRERGLYLAEKMKPGETVATAAYRGIEEELGVAQTAVTLHPDTHHTYEKTSYSHSYPGLATTYTFHRIETHVDGLPQTDFWVENTAVHDGDPVRRHLWAWRAEES